MKYNRILVTLGLLLCQNPEISAAEAEAEVPELKQEAERKEGAALAGVQKISDDLYVGKVNDQFYLAMQRVTDENVASWQNYASTEYGQQKRANFNTAGSGHFDEALKDYNKVDELWIAYSSSKPTPVKDFSDIEMYFTVITSPEALFTTHMGISYSLWGLALKEGKKTKRQQSYPSVDLHSFAAKIMLIRNPKRVYMFTHPTEVMRNILLKNMPEGTVFVGDDQYKKKLEEIRGKGYLYYLDPRLGESGEETAKFMYDRLGLEEKLKLLKSNPPRLRKQDKPPMFFVTMPTGQMMEVSGSLKEYKWLFLNIFFKVFNPLSNPYVLVDLDALAGVTVLVPTEGKK